MEWHVSKGAALRNASKIFLFLSLSLSLSLPLSTLAFLPSLCSNLPSLVVFRVAGTLVANPLLTS